MVENNLILNECTLVDAALIHSSELKKKKDSKGKTFSNVAYNKEAT